MKMLKTDCRSGGCGFDSRRPRLKGPVLLGAGSFCFWGLFQKHYRPRRKVLSFVAAV